MIQIFCWNQQKQQQCAACCCCCWLHIRFIFIQIKWNSDQIGKAFADASAEIEGITIVANHKFIDRTTQLIFGTRKSHAYNSPSNRNFLFAAVHGKWQRLTVARASEHVCVWMRSDLQTTNVIAIDLNLNGTEVVFLYDFFCISKWRLIHIMAQSC